MTKEKIIFKKYNGISLAELLIYIFIMSLMILSSSAVAVSYIKGRSSIKKYQQNIEEMSLVINDMAKRIRMSNCETASDCEFSSDKIKFKENSTGDLITYTFASIGTPANPIHKLTMRVNANSPVDMLDSVGGSFLSNGSTIPLVTIKMWKVDQGGTPLDNTTIQTSVSQRSGYSNETP